MCKPDPEFSKPPGPGALSVAVLGVGAMGSFIAAEFALAGHDVRVTASPATSPQDAVRRVLEAGRGGLSADQIAHRDSTAEAAAGADLVVESLPEELAVKQRELREAQRVAPTAILTTNTSSLTVTEIAAGLEDAARLMGAHYVNPPWAFTIVELIAGEATDPALVSELEAVLRDLGRTPVRIMRDVPGFVFNRLQFALLREAIALVQAGVVSAEDLDRIIVNGLGRRWSAVGPLASATLGGQALFDQIARTLYPHLSSAATPGEMELTAPTSAAIARVRRDRDRRLADSDDLPPLWRARVGNVSSAA